MFAWFRPMGTGRQLPPQRGRGDTRAGYALALNTCKPSPADIVAYPAIDVAIQLRNENKLQPADIKSVALRAHLLVLNLMGKTGPHAGPEDKFGIYDATAVALVVGVRGR